MFKVVSNNITITRGDTGLLKINIEAPDGTDYKLQEGDKAVLTVKQSTMFFPSCIKWIAKSYIEESL